MPRPVPNKSLLQGFAINAGTIEADEEQAKANQWFEWPLGLLLPGLLFIIVLAVSPVKEEVSVSANASLLKIETTSSGTTFLPQQTEQMQDCRIQT